MKDLIEKLAGLSEKEPEKELKWRRKQPPGKIMKPSTFQKIKRAAAASGADDPEKVAGAAYWTTVKAKYRKRKKT